MVSSDQKRIKDFGYYQLRSIKDICGYFPCAPFPHLETGKVVWVLSFDLLRIRIITAFRYSHVISVFPHFLEK